MEKIEIHDTRYHSKASEKYVDVTFFYPGNIEYKTSIPIEYRRTGISLKDDEVNAYLLKIYDEVNPQNWKQWKTAQQGFWSDKKGAVVTRSFFEVLAKTFDWCCVSCTLPQNPNWARRTQDIKQFGYTIATNTKKHCTKCHKNTTQLILVPIMRGGVPFFYAGGPTWDKDIPQTGKKAELGCIGCAWYDIKTWRAELIKKIGKEI